MRTSRARTQLFSNLMPAPSSHKTLQANILYNTPHPKLVHPTHTLRLFLLLALTSVCLSIPSAQSNMTLPSSHHFKGKIPPKFPKPRSSPKHGAEFIRDKIMSMNFKDTRFNNGDGQGKGTDDTESWSGASVPLTNGPHTKIVWVLMRAIEKGPYGAIAHGAVISIMYDVSTYFLFLIHEAWVGKTDAAKATALGRLESLWPTIQQWALSPARGFEPPQFLITAIGEAPLNVLYFKSLDGPHRTATCARDGPYAAGMSMAYHVLPWFFGNGEPTPLLLHCKHTLTQWILTDELEKAHPTYLTQTPARSGFIPIIFLNQTKVDNFGLIPPHFNNDMNMYSGHLKTALDSQKVYYAPRVGAGISAEKYDLMGGIQGLRIASKAGTLANLISQVFQLKRLTIRTKLPAPLSQVYTPPTT